MTQETVLTEDQRRLIHALQIHPRVRWNALEPVLGVSATTLARRWRALCDSGVVWTSGYLLAGRESRAAVVEIDAAPGDMAELVRALSGISAAMTLDIVSSGTTVVVTVGAENEERLAGFMLETIRGLPHVRDARSYLLTAHLRTGDQWSIRALDEAEVRGVPGPRPPRARAPREIAPELERALIDSLGRDARAPVASLARELGVSEQRVTDAIATLIHRRGLRLRTDIINTLTAWPVHMWYFADVPASRLQVLSASIAALPEVRFAGTSVGPANLVFDVWLREPRMSHQLEKRIHDLVGPELRLRRELVLHTPKRMGHMFDARGRHRGGFVPLPRTG